LQLRNSVINPNTSDGVAFMTTDDMTDIRYCAVEWKDGHAVNLTSPIVTTQISKGNIFSGFGAAGSTDAAVYNSITPTVMDSYASSNYDTDTNTYNNEGSGMSFTGDGGTIDAVQFYLRRVGSPTGNLRMYIYAHSGTWGSTGVPTGSPLATSDPVDVSTIGTSMHFEQFNFPTPFTTSAGVHYFAVFDYTTLTEDVSNQIIVGYDSSSPTAGGNLAYKPAGTWLSNPGDWCFFVYKGGSITLNVTSGGSTPTVRNATGSWVFVNNNINVTLTKLKDNTEVRVYAAGTTTELAGIENATDGTTDNRSFGFALTAGVSVDIRIYAVGYYPADLLAYTVPSLDTSLPIQQITDRWYTNP
jgi:hypothetical protein